MATIQTKNGTIEIPDGDPRIQAHDALNRAAERICRAAYSQEVLVRKKRGVRTPPKTFTPPAEVAELVAAMPMVLDGTLDPETAMNLISRGDIQKLRLS